MEPDLSIQWSRRSGPTNGNRSRGGVWYLFRLDCGQLA